MPNKHWLDNLGWKMVENIHDVVLECTKKVRKESPFLAFSTNEITTSHIEFWISLYGYVLENWRQILVLLNLERVINNVTIKNIYNVML
jgi:hypothetical protein